MRRVSLGLLVLVALAVSTAAGGANSSSDQPTLHRGCPPGDGGSTYPATTFKGALAQAKRAVYGQRFTIQGHTYTTGPWNTELVAAVRVQNLPLVPGMQRMFSVMHRRCGKHAPYIAWAFTFHRGFEIVPDYVPYFVIKTAGDWYVF